MVSNYTLNQVPIELEMMPKDARVWIWAASRHLNNKELMQVGEYMRQFTEEWTSHNRALSAHATIFYNRFITVFLDEASSSMASGCSIDKLSRHIQYLSDLLELDLLDREHFHFLINEEVIPIHRETLTQNYSDSIIDNETMVFDNLVKNKEEFFNSWLKPFKTSWHFRFI